MNFIFFFMSLIFTLSILLYIINIYISKKMFLDREKNSPFECGFDPISKTSMPFTIQFFLISLIFLIFDIEIVLLLPIIILLKLPMIKSVIFLTMFFLMILFMGLIAEWYNSYLNWIN